MRTTERIVHVKCDTCGTDEPVKYRSILVSSGDTYVICNSCLTVLGNMDSDLLFCIAFKAGKCFEGRRMENNSEYEYKDNGFKYTESDFNKDIGELVKRLKYRNVEDSHE